MNFLPAIYILLALLWSPYFVNGQQSSDQTYQLVWSDEFSEKGKPDGTKWVYDLGDGCPTVCQWGNQELQYYTTDSSNVYVENGCLYITARKENKGSREFTSARLKTKGKGDWTYGKIEVRAKLPTGRGTWPAIWMLPTQSAYGGWPKSGEIDIMEHVGYEPDSIFGTVHTTSYNHIIGTQKGGAVYAGDCEKSFHVYGIEWNENKIDFFVDDLLYFTFTNENKTNKEWPFDQPFHLLLNVAAGGNWGGKKGVDMNIWPQQMVVDYVRVYQLPSSKM